MSTFTCIVCPRGCTLTAEQASDGSITVTGNFCKRGEAFARSELTRPMRTISSTVRTVFHDTPALPVRVSADIPKDRIFDVMAEIKKVTLDKPVRRGGVIIPDVCSLGVDVIATADLTVDK